MIQKILIANRGEIASRIIRTCKDLGIQTVAVYSEADQKAPYVHMADESCLLGPSRVNESYLNIDKIISIAKETQVDAIHPGYGFLSENSQFVKACEAADLIFIGPKGEAIEKMGNKIEARNTMKKAGVPIVPGTNEAVSSVDEAIAIAKDIGYPVMLKASAGGGGIGMQVVLTDEELKSAFASNSKRAESFFGDGSMFIEKKIEDARHIEIQILADKQGHIVHLFERDCSIQRRNQKVVEEAPSPVLSKETRFEMGEAAVKAALSIGYTNAGTVEFLVDKFENFYFLEMNTRIQVEHPVTEEVTGVDIVKEQIHIADNQPLSFKQQDVEIKGHAIEVRVYAEDPETFFPSPGRITTFQLPTGQNIRNEAGVASNLDVTPFYDPMISKLIVKGETREEAIVTLNLALNDFKVEGIKTNIPMLKKIINHDLFKAGQVTTTFIDEHYLQAATKK